MTGTRARQLVQSGVAVMLLGAIAAVPAVVGAQEPSEFRTSVEGLGGYTATSVGAPLSVQFFNATGGAIPTKPGEPEFEATESYTRTTLGTGPQSRATASSAWPGPTFGDGFATVCDCGEDYFLKADARYPEGPFEDEQGSAESGSGMFAQTFGLDVAARSASARSPNPEGAGFGNAASDSTSTVTEDGVVVTTTDARVQDVRLAGGVITIDSVRTVMQATSDGQTATTTGTTTVNGFTFLGVPFRVNDQGVQAGGEGTLVPPPGNVATPEEMGITVELVDHDEQVTGATGRRVAGGLIISIDTMSLAQGLAAFEDGSGIDVPFDPLSPPQTGVNDDLDGAIAQAWVEAVFPFATGNPDVRYVLGRGEVVAAASPPFTLPDVDPPAFDGPPGTSSGSPSTSGGDVNPPSFPETSAPTIGGAEPPTQVAPPAPDGEVLASAPQLPDFFDGLPLAVFLLGGLLTALGGYGLHGLTGAALGPGSSEFCETGAPKRVPDLRGS